MSDRMMLVFWAAWLFVVCGLACYAILVTLPNFMVEALAILI